MQPAASCPCASPPGVGPGGSVVEMCGWGELRTRGVGDASSGHTCYSPKAQQHEEGSGGQAWACCCLHWVTLRLCLTGWHEMLGGQGLAESWAGTKRPQQGADGWVQGSHGRCQSLPMPARTIRTQVLVPVLEADLTFHPASQTSKKPVGGGSRQDPSSLSLRSLREMCE